MGLWAKLLFAASAASLCAASPVGLDPQAPGPVTQLPISSTEAGVTPGRGQRKVNYHITPGAGTTDPKFEVDVGGIPPSPERRRAPSPELQEAAEAEAAACTSTLKRTPSYPCITEGYETVYPSTRTVFAQVDCGGCQELFIPREVYFCPMRRILGIRTVHEPSTSWSTVCAGRATRIGLGRRDHHATQAEAAAAAVTTPPTNWETADENGREEDLQARQGVACRTTRVVQPQRTAGPVATQYQRVVTETARLNCGGCQLQLSTAAGGYGPVVRFTTTTTVSAGTSTVFVCQ
ncbi:hypothetical protein MAPG_01520 [Magnaporthiopsis poae ATCC 64411]|uniref:Uncharacterized protein n=1 Tax=Magnaporthiopsis poae (strain ATCC 64411 / 73-15) TaxID=644358 RepID=A0A0C4DNX3_MAGP6|nr:hypothetical protein MAPG_01520 [Magnaporthiopsis poae ATCC 64411]